MTTALQSGLALVKLRVSEEARRLARQMILDHVFRFLTIHVFELPFDAVAYVSVDEYPLLLLFLFSMCND